MMTDPRRDDTDSAGPALSRAEMEPSPAQFLSLFLKDQHRIYCYLVTLVIDPHVAEDLLQETALVLLQKSDEFQSGSNFFSWACQTAYFLARNYRRKKEHRLLVVDDDVLEQLAEVPLDDERHSEIRRAALYECLKKLSPRDRHLFETRYVTTLKGNELAAHLG